MRLSCNQSNMSSAEHPHASFAELNHCVLPIHAHACQELLGILASNKERRMLLNCAPPVLFRAWNDLLFFESIRMDMDMLCTSVSAACQS